MPELALLAAGIGLLLIGGTLLVRGATELAVAAGVSPLVVGLTVVAFGNVVGSNISNLALVLGAAALMRPIDIRGDLVRREVPLLLLATCIITIMALDLRLEGEASVIGRSDSLVLFLIFGVFLYIIILDLLRAPRTDPLLTEVDEAASCRPGCAPGAPGCS